MLSIEKQRRRNDLVFNRFCDRLRVDVSPHPGFPVVLIAALLAILAAMVIRRRVVGTYAGVYDPNVFAIRSSAVSMMRKVIARRKRELRMKRAKAWIRSLWT